MDADLPFEGNDGQGHNDNYIRNQNNSEDWINRQVLQKIKSHIVIDGGKKQGFNTVCMMLHP